MNELSKSFEHIQKRKESEIEVNKKAREKIFRALLSMIPGVEHLLDISMSMVDAQREQAIEDAIKVLENKFGKQQIERIELIQNEQLVRVELEKICTEVEVIKREYLSIIESSNFYNSIELKTAIISISTVTTQTLENTEVMRVQLNNILKILTDVPREGTTSLQIKETNINEQFDDEVLVKLGEQVISRVNELIERNEFISAHSILDGIINANGFNERPEELKIAILATKGNIYVKELDKRNAELIFQKLENIPLDNKKKWNFVFSYGSLQGSEILINEALTRLRNLGLSDKELTIKKSTFYLAIGNTEEIINLLGGGDEND